VERVVTQIYGTPARHARRLRRAAQLRTVGGVAVSFGGVATLLGGGAVPDVIAVIALIAGAAVAQPQRVRWLQASAGIRSEDRVAKLLARSGVAAVVHGADLARPGHSRGDVDHVALGPVTAAIETKTGRGSVKVRGEQLQVGRRTLPGRPLRQARIHAEQLSRHTGTQASAVLCVVDMSGRPFTVDGVTLCSAADLSGVLASLPQTLSREAALAAAARLPLAS
jgi:hypothetical protein